MPKLTPARAQEVLNSLGAEVAILDEAGKITYVNQEWRNFSTSNGGEDEAYLGADYGALLRGEGTLNRDADRALLSVIEGKAERARVNYVCDAPGIRRHFVANAVRTDIGGKRATIIVHNLVSEREIGARLGHQNEEPGLQSLRERLIRLVSHQFRTPLTPLLVDSKRLLELSNDDTLPIVERVRRNIRRLDQLVSVGIDMRRLESEAGVNLQPRPLLEALRLAAEYGIQNEISGEKIAIEVSGHEVTAPVDLAWLGRAVREIISNAVHHGEGPFGVTIQREGGKVKLTVTNQGSPDVRENWFESFTQEDEFLGLGEGLGLGLAIVQRVAQIHGGEATAELTGDQTIVSLIIPTARGRIAA